MYRTGIGYDSHRFSSERKLILGGVEIPFDKGLMGHSDADVLCHSMIDAILGAAGLGDIGNHFPDNDMLWKDASSIDLLRMVVQRVADHHYEIIWIDASIIAETPKLSPYVRNMKDAIASSGIATEKVNIKATTNEGMGFIGRGEGIAALSVCLLKERD